MPYRPPLAEDLERVYEAIGAPDWEQLRGQHLLITGGTGFVGKWLLATLLHADGRLGLGIRIAVLSRDPVAFQTQAPDLARAKNVELVRGDVRDFTHQTSAPQWIVHAATDVVAQAPALDIFDSCVQGTRRVLAHAVASAAPRVLLVGSGALYGAQPPHLEALAETYAGAPDLGSSASAYGEGKRVSEWLGATYSKLHGLDVRAARCFAFLGPYQPLDAHFALGNFLGAALAGRAIVIRGDGTACRSYLYAADMAIWLWAILLRGRPNATYNVGGQEVVSMQQLATRIKSLTESSSAIEIQNLSVPGMASARYVPDVRKAQEELALPTAVSLNDAIVRTARWHRAAAEIST